MLIGWVPWSATPPAPAILLHCLGAMPGKAGSASATHADAFPGDQSARTPDGFFASLRMTKGDRLRSEGRSKSAPLREDGAEWSQGEDR